MKMITKRGIFLLILSLAFIVGVVFMTVSLVNNSDTWVMKRFNSHVYSDGELIGAGTIYDKDGDALVQTKDGERVSKYVVFSSRKDYSCPLFKKPD